VGSAGEIPPLNDCFLIKLDIEDSPSALVPLDNIYDMVTSILNDNYRETIVQILEDTMWINATMMETFMNAPFGILDLRENGVVVSLRTAGLQRLVTHTVASRTLPIITIKNPLLIRFQSPDLALLTPSRMPPAAVGTDSACPDSRSGPPSNVSEAKLLDQVSELPGTSPVFQQQQTCVTGNPPAPEPGNPRTGEASTATMSALGMTTVSILRGKSDSGRREDPGSVPGTGPTFCGNPIDMDRRPTNTRGARDYDTYDVGCPPGNPVSTRRGLLFDHIAERTPHTRTPTRSHPSSEEISFWD
jgi:hypothetical protein